MTDKISESFNGAVEQQITAGKSPDCNGLSFKDFKLLRPDGTLLIEPFSLELKAGDRLMISGPSGCGKSSILRALRGLWPWGSGIATLDSKVRTLIVVQKPHLPLTTLKGIVSFPDDAGAHSDESVAAALAKAGLENLVADMNDTAKDGSYWERLSGGEKQRISFARVFLLKPAILGLDEVTASLDVAAQDQLYKTILEEVPDTIIVSISHRMELAQYHNMHANIENKRFELKPIAQPPAQGPASPAP